MIGNTWNMPTYTVGKYIFKASAANGISNKLDYLTEVEHVLQFIIAPPPQVDTVIYLNYDSCFTPTSTHIISHATQLLLGLVCCLQMLLTWKLTKQISSVQQRKLGDLAP